MAMSNTLLNPANHLLLYLVEVIICILVFNSAAKLIRNHESEHLKSVKKIAKYVKCLPFE